MSDNPYDQYDVCILADSIGPHGIRLTTVEATFPRFILAELNTHRMLSRNSASSRAIPTEKQIERVMETPFVPEFNKRVKGMGVGEALSDSQNRKMKLRWLEARDAAVEAAQGFLEVDKSRANRLLEPFMWHTAIISATEWDNFFALRADPNAQPQPEFQRIAQMMQEAMWWHEPFELNYGEWHLPMLTVDEFCEASETKHWEVFGRISAGRIARVSFDTHNNFEERGLSLARCDKLISSGHWSPTEHPAQCVETDVPNLGNFRGFRQLRKRYANEDNFARLSNT